MMNCKDASRLAPADALSYNQRPAAARVAWAGETERAHARRRGLGGAGGGLGGAGRGLRVPALGRVPAPRVPNDPPAEGAAGLAGGAGGVLRPPWLPGRGLRCGH